MGRPKEFTERVLAPFRDGTLARISRALAEGEDRTAFIREAVDRELARREKSAPKRRAKPRAKSQ